MPPTEPPDTTAKRRRRLAEHFAATQARGHYGRPPGGYQPETRGYPTVDGAPQTPNFGGGIQQRPIAKVRPRRNRRA